MQFNYRVVFWLLAIALMAIAMEFLILEAKAADITESYVVVDNSTPHADYPSERIMQGQCVEINKTYDISGLGWWTGKIAYYGRYTDDFSPVNTTLVAVEEIPFQVSKLENFYINPINFSSKLGYWYVYYPDNNEKAANNRLFFVSDHCKTTKPETNVTSLETILKPKSTFLPEKSANAILLARGDTIHMNITTNNNRLWLFGPDNFGVYDRQVNGQDVVLEAKDFESSETGDYFGAVVSAGKNNIVEVQYNPKYQHGRFNYTYKAMTSPFVSGETLSVDGIQPLLVYPMLQNYVSGTIDDNIETFKIKFQEPEIQIMRIDLESTPSNITIANISGYTNAVAGTTISVTMDLEKTDVRSYRENTMEATAIGDDITLWRQFNLKFPVDLSQKSAGNHYITAKTKNGASATVPIYVREELPDHYVPPQYLKYIDNSPYLEPKVIVNETVVTVEKIKIEKVTETVVEKVDYVTLAKETIWQALPIAAFICGCLPLILYCVYVGIRAYGRRTGNFVK